MNEQVQDAIAEFGATAIEAIHKLQREIRELRGQVEHLERDNEALRLRLAEEQETAEW